MKFNEKLEEKESSLRKLIDGCVCKNGNSPISVSTSSSNSTSKPLKKQKLRHFDNGDDCSDEQNELSSTVDTPTDQAPDLELISQKVQSECEKYLQSNLLACLEKSSYWSTWDNRLEEEIKVYRAEIDRELDRREKELNAKLAKSEDKLSENLTNSLTVELTSSLAGSLTGSLTNKLSQKWSASEKKLLKELEEQNQKIKKQFDDQAKQSQKELNKIKQENNKQRTEIEQLKKLLGKYEKLYCDEQLIDEDDDETIPSPSMLAGGGEPDDNCERMGTRSKGKSTAEEKPKDRSREKTKKEEPIAQRTTKVQRKCAKVANLSMSLRKTVSTVSLDGREADESTDPIKSRLRNRKTKDPTRLSRWIC
ncbi:hypothetical protein L1887_52808 [Cichorium endivia]|nr:hypothetical protein L1887_52808 [Cichorium endivia]